MSSIESIRAELPVTKKYAYFDHAAVGPLPVRVTEAAKRVLEEKSEGDLHWDEWEEETESARKAIANLIHARDDEIALVHSTSEALALVANGLTYEKGQNIVTSDMEFASNLFPWQALAKRYGLELRTVGNHDGRLLLKDLADAIDSKTKLVAVSYVQYANGFRTNLAELSRIAHEKGAYVVTDAVQAVGQMPIDIRQLGVDFLASSGYKWMLSPIATGFLYVEHELLDELWPTIIGYRADEHPLRYEFQEFQPAASARRYEGGQVNFAGFAGMRQAIGLLSDFGLENVWRRILSLTARLTDGVKENAKVQLKSCLESECRSAILNAACKDPKHVTAKLLEKGIVVCVRAGGLRISPHFYNTDEEIDRLTSELRTIP